MPKSEWLLHDQQRVIRASPTRTGPRRHPMLGHGRVAVCPARSAFRLWPLASAYAHDRNCDAAMPQCRTETDTANAKPAKTAHIATAAATHGSCNGCAPLATSTSRETMTAPDPKTPADKTVETAAAATPPQANAQPLPVPAPDVAPAPPASKPVEFSVPPAPAQAERSDWKPTKYKPYQS